MKRLIWSGAILLVGLAALNARLDAARECGCQPECWCQKPILRHFRWVLPITHRSVSPQLKARMVAEGEI
jgi:hypothetical protein